jgi:hypothetical protein
VRQGGPVGGDGVMFGGSAQAFEPVEFEGLVGSLDGGSDGPAPWICDSRWIGARERETADQGCDDEDGTERS